MRVGGGEAGEGRTGRGRSDIYYVAKRGRPRECFQSRANLEVSARAVRDRRHWREETDGNWQWQAQARRREARKMHTSPNAAVPMSANLLSPLLSLMIRLFEEMSYTRKRDC